MSETWHRHWRQTNGTTTTVCMYTEKKSTQAAYVESQLPVFMLPTTLTLQQCYSVDVHSIQWSAVLLFVLPQPWPPLVLYRLKTHWNWLDLWSCFNNQISNVIHISHACLITMGMSYHHGPENQGPTLGCCWANQLVKDILSITLLKSSNFLVFRLSIWPLV